MGLPVAVAVKIAAVDPAQSGDGETVKVSTGSGDGLTVNTYGALPGAQLLVGATEIVATPVPTVKLIESVVLVPLQPVPLTIQV